MRSAEAFRHGLVCVGYGRLNLENDFLRIVAIQGKLCLT